MSNKGFFFGSTLSKSTQPPPSVPYCGACGLYKKCETPKMKYKGKGRRRILVIGDKPGQRDDMKGHQFSGDAGALLRQAFRKHGVDLTDDCVVTNAIICYSKAKPTADQITYCQPNLVKLVERFKPEIIIPLGGAVSYTHLTLPTKA